MRPRERISTHSILVSKPSKIRVSPLCVSDSFPAVTSERKVPRGQVVKLTVGIWPMGLYYKAGESLVFTVSGFDPAYPEFPDLPPTRGKILSTRLSVRR